MSIFIAYSQYPGVANTSYIPSFFCLLRNMHSTSYTLTATVLKIGTSYEISDVDIVISLAP
jgi:hypothetical protein